jgi:hypothetical protein
MRARWSIRLGAPVALALALGLAPRAASAQSDEEKAAARALATQGIDAFNAKKYAEALDLINRAEAILHAPPHVLFIARAQAGMGRLVAARESYLKLSREDIPASAPPAFKRAQQDAKAELASIEPKIAQLKVNLEGVGQKTVTLKIDDQPVSSALIGVFRPIDPGKHEVVAYPTGQSPVKASITLGDGEKKEMKVVIPEGAPGPGVPANPADNPDANKAPPPDHVEPKPASSGGFFTPMRGAGLGAGVVGVAGVVVGSIFAARGFSTQAQADDLAKKLCKTPTDCSNNPSAEGKIKPLDDKAASQKTIGVIGLAAGGVALAAGVTLIILGKPKPPSEPAKASVTPWFTGSMGGLQGSF